LTSKVEPTTAKNAICGRIEQSASENASLAPFGRETAATDRTLSVCLQERQAIKPTSTLPSARRSARADDPYPLGNGDGTTVLSVGLDLGVDDFQPEERRYRITVGQSMIFGLLEGSPEAQ
jgi:hypothetical protein